MTKEKGKPKVSSTSLKKNMALRFSYDGSNFSGLASQKHQNTIDFHLKKALLDSNLAPPEVKLTYAGRTDCGVSAINMVASFTVYALEGDRSFNYDTILNCHLPEEIRVTGYSFVSEDFSARFSCKKRKYKYFFLKNNLDISKMILGANFFLKQKNFRNFCKGHKEEEEKYFIRPLASLEIKEEGNICVMEVSSISFLHNMIRKIFHVLEKVGRNEIQIDGLKEFFEGEKVVGTADPENLLFVSAEYEGISFENSLRNKEKGFLVSHVRKFVYENVYEMEKSKKK